MEFMVLVAAVCTVRMMLMVMVLVQAEEVLLCQVSAGFVVEVSEREWSASRGRKGGCEDVCGRCKQVTVS